MKPIMFERLKFAGRNLHEKLISSTLLGLLGGGVEPCRQPHPASRGAFAAQKRGPAAAMLALPLMVRCLLTACARLPELRTQPAALLCWIAKRVARKWIHARCGGGQPPSPVGEEDYESESVGGRPRPRRRGRGHRARWWGLAVRGNKKKLRATMSDKLSGAHGWILNWPA
jgi:hypothetical protein